LLIQTACRSAAVDHRHPLAGIKGQYFDGGDPAPQREIGCSELYDTLSEGGQADKRENLHHCCHAQPRIGRRPAEPPKVAAGSAVESLLGIGNRDGLVNHEKRPGDVDELSISLMACFACPR
jgi:hypothetical protein